MITFEHEGAEYRLRFGMAAMRTYSEATGNALAADMQRLSDFETDAAAPRIMCDLFWSALKPQPERDAVADIIDDLGLQAAMDLLGRAAAEAFPSEKN